MTPSVFCVLGGGGRGGGISLTGGVHEVPAGGQLGLGVRLGHHGRAERLHDAGLAGPRCGLGDVGRGSGGGARAAGVEGRGAVETGAAAAASPHAAAAQVHGQGLL